MKIILSHDIDHLHWNEHYLKDLYLIGSIYRNSLGFIKKKIDNSLFAKRLKCYGRIHRIPELVEYYKQEKISSNFFFGMDKALHLSYNYKSTDIWIKELIKNGHNIGVHGIAFADKLKIEMEKHRFEEISQINSFGIRTHYLRLNGYSHNLFDAQGYLYDSSIESIMHPFKVNNMWEIPISIMDSSLVVNAQLNQDLKTWKKNSLLKLDESIEKNIPFFVINFHDIYFSENFPVMKEWYIWIIDYLKTKNYEFTTLEEAVKELNNIEI